MEIGLEKMMEGRVERGMVNEMEKGNNEESEELKQKTRNKNQELKRE